MSSLTLRGRAPARVAPALVLGLLVAAAASGCSTTQELPKASSLTVPQAATEPAPQPVQATGAGDGVEVTVTDSTAGASPGEHLSPVSQVYTVTASGPLGPQALLRLDLDHAVPARTPVVVVTRAAAGDPWTYRSATLSADQRHVEVATTDTGQLAALALDRESAVADFKQDLRAQPSAGVVDRSIARPTCRRPDAAREDGYSVEVPTGRGLGWCLGMQDGRRVLEVSNRRGLPVQLTSPGAEAPRTGRVRPRWIAWLGALGETDTPLAPAGTATYDVELEPETERVVAVTTGPHAQALRLLWASVQSVADTLTRFGAGATDRARLYDALLARPRCARALDRGATALLARCLSPAALAATLGDRAVLLEQVVTGPSLPGFFTRQADRRAARAERDEAWQVVVRRAAPDFSALAGTFSGTTRSLTISAKGLVTEKVSTTVQPAPSPTPSPTRTPVTKAGAKPSGKPGKPGKPAAKPAAKPVPVVKPVVELVYQLAEPTTEGDRSTAKATLLRVVLHDPALLGGQVPKVGDTGTLTLSAGVLTPPFLRLGYCGRGAARSACA